MASCEDARRWRSADHGDDFPHREGVQKAPLAVWERAFLATTAVSLAY